MPKPVLLFILGSSLFFSCKVTQSTELKISGGDLVPTDAHPAVFKLFLAEGDDPLHPYCTGTATTDRHLLTSGHCLSALRSNQQILVVTDQPHFASKAFFLKSFLYNQRKLHDRDAAVPDFGFLEFEEGTFLDKMKIATSTPNTLEAEAIGMGCNVFFKNLLDDVPQSINQKLLTFKWTAPFALDQHPPEGFWQFTSEDQSRLPIQVCVGDSGGPLIVNKEIIGVHSYKNDVDIDDVQKKWKSFATNLTHRPHRQQIRLFFEGDLEDFVSRSFQAPEEQSTQLQKDLADIRNARHYIQTNFESIKAQIERSYDSHFRHNFKTKKE